MIFLVHAVLAGHLGATGPQQATAMSAREACRADYKTYCAGVQPGGGRIRACLEQNRANLSAECRASLADGKS